MPFDDEFWSKPRQNEDADKLKNLTGFTVSLPIYSDADDKFAKWVDRVKNILVKNFRMMCRCAVLFMVALQFSQAQGAQQQECVGRYSLTLPSEADVAMTTRTAFIGQQISPTRFGDDKTARLSSFIYNGTFSISRSVSRSEFDLFIKEAKANAAASATKPYASQRFSIVDRSDPNSLVWKGPKTSGFYTYIDGTAIEFVGMSSSGQSAVETLEHSKARADGEVPHVPGVCLPGIFVMSDQPDYVRDVGVTFRLKSHPDVLIFVRDSKALPNQPKLTSRQQSELLWTGGLGVGKKVKLHGVLPWSGVKLDGREGVGSFGTITRIDDSMDYGYLVAVQGDPDATTDTPDLVLYVERNASASQGKPPVSANEIEKIGEEVAASIRRR
ncbi:MULTISPECIES: T6SS immunity protein Tli4 family protein [Paraburkholderia]|uniref:T6SS immunity protein Tli4 family protein n=1 Tax=Paraburkholderia TaxID=1822464 RepID=UPI0015919B1B|nr:T6SS immunity protein Tli4 family protein [Paraburkholderia tropica]